MFLVSFTTSRDDTWLRRISHRKGGNITRILKGNVDLQKGDNAGTWKNFKQNSAIKLFPDILPTE